MKISNLEILLEINKRILWGKNAFNAVTIMSFTLMVFVISFGTMGIGPIDSGVFGLHPQNFITSLKTFAVIGFFIYLYFIFHFDKVYQKSCFDSESFNVYYNKKLKSQSTLYHISDYTLEENIKYIINDLNDFNFRNNNRELIFTEKKVVRIDILNRFLEVSENSMFKDEVLEAKIKEILNK